MVTVDRIPGSLRALLSHLVDYAGLYPPAALPLDEVLRHYEHHRSSPESWMLNRLVLPAAKLPEVQLQPGWRITLLVDAAPGPLPPAVETLEWKQPRRLSLPTYCEAPLDTIEDAYAKVRTGGLTPEAVPSAASLTDFLTRAAARRLAFKATAGLHHPLRSGGSHGFLNLFVAAVFAWYRMEGVSEVLEETSADAFEFADGCLKWRSRALLTAQIAEARRDFAHSFGSCSFEEPVTGLRNLGLLP